MKVKELLEKIQELPISKLENEVFVGKAIENYPYGPDYELDKAQGCICSNKNFIIYSI